MHRITADASGARPALATPALRMAELALFTTYLNLGAMPRRSTGRLALPLAVSAFEGSGRCCSAPRSAMPSAARAIGVFQIDAGLSGLLGIAPSAGLTGGVFLGVCIGVTMSRPRFRGRR